MTRLALAGFMIWLAAYPIGAIVLVAPGMLLDTISAIWFPRVFPNIAPESAGLFGGWLLFCNVIALISAAVAAGFPIRGTRVAPDSPEGGTHATR